MLSKTQIGYLLRESFAGFTRRKLTTGVTILIMGSALLILALFTIVTLNLGSLLETARGGIDLRVFLHEELGAQREAELQPRLVVIPGVQSVAYISQDMALRELQAQLGDEVDIMTAVDTNPLPPSYQVTLSPDARTAAAVERIEQEILLWPEVQEVVYAQRWIEVLERWNFVFRLASLIVSLVVFAAAVFVISNTVKLTMASQARLIEIMKLVGATNWFIRTPYLCEGMLQGLLAGVIAMGILAGTYSLLRSQMDGLVFFTPWQMVGFVLLCISLGLVGSWAAIRKYLRT